MRFPLDDFKLMFFCCRGGKKFLHLKWKLSEAKTFSIYFPSRKFLVLLSPKFPYIRFYPIFSLLSPLKYVLDSVLDWRNYQQRNLIKKIYAIKLCVIFESSLFSLLFPAEKCYASQREGTWFVVHNRLPSRCKIAENFFSGALLAVRKAREISPWYPEIFTLTITQYRGRRGVFVSFVTRLCWS